MAWTGTINNRKLGAYLATKDSESNVSVKYIEEIKDFTYTESMIDGSGLTLGTAVSSTATVNLINLTTERNFTKNKKVTLNMGCIPWSTYVQQGEFIYDTNNGRNCDKIATLYVTSLEESTGNNSYKLTLADVLSFDIMTDPCPKDLFTDGAIVSCKSFAETLAAYCNDRLNIGVEESDYYEYVKIGTGFTNATLGTKLLLDNTPIREVFGYLAVYSGGVIHCDADGFMNVMFLGGLAGNITADMIYEDGFNFDRSSYEDETLKVLGIICEGNGKELFKKIDGNANSPVLYCSCPFINNAAKVSNIWNGIKSPLSTKQGYTACSVKWSGNGSYSLGSLVNIPRSSTLTYKMYIMERTMHYDGSFYEEYSSFYPSKQELGSTGETEKEIKKYFDSNYKQMSIYPWTMDGEFPQPSLGSSANATYFAVGSLNMIMVNISELWPDEKLMLPVGLYASDMTNLKIITLPKYYDDIVETQGWHSFNDPDYPNAEYYISNDDITLGVDSLITGAEQFQWFETNVYIKQCTGKNKDNLTVPCLSFEYSSQNPQVFIQNLSFLIIISSNSDTSVFDTIENRCYAISTEAGLYEYPYPSNWSPDFPDDDI